jgi:hypothetical protein
MALKSKSLCVRRENVSGTVPSPHRRSSRCGLAGRGESIRERPLTFFVMPQSRSRSGGSTPPCGEVNSPLRPRPRPRHYPSSHFLLPWTDDNRGISVYAPTCVRKHVSARTYHLPKEGCINLSGRNVVSYSEIWYCGCISLGTKRHEYPPQRENRDPGQREGR